MIKFTMIAGVSDSIVNFDANISSGAAPLTVQFTDNTSLYRNEWSWDFGDGTIVDHAKDPVHTYTEPGVYTVSLTESAKSSPIGSEVKTGFINVYSPTSNAGTGSSGINNTVGQAPTITPGPGSASVIPGTIETARPPSGEVAPAVATPLPTPKGIITVWGGTTVTEDTLQLILAGAIAVVIAIIVIFIFSNLSKRSGEKGRDKPAAKPKPKPQSRPPAPPTKSPVQGTAPKPSKKSEDISQDYIYGLVMGKADNEAENPLAQLQNEYKKIK